MFYAFLVNIIFTYPVANFVIICRTGRLKLSAFTSSILLPTYDLQHFLRTYIFDASCCQCAVRRNRLLTFSCGKEKAPLI
jgi:hypothetical protein